MLIKIFANLDEKDIASCAQVRTFVRLVFAKRDNVHLLLCMH
jgi:hypothetical protein